MLPIKRLFNSRQFEQAVNRARQSRHERIRYIVAEFLIEILVDAVNSGNADSPEIIQQLGRWAYELCPNDPAFQEIYRQLKLRY